MEFLAIIPARYASTRFPGKPLAVIGGKPMVRHVYERVSSVFADCFVATDDERIQRAVEDFGGRCIMTDSGHRSGTDRCAEALRTAREITGKKYDVVVNIQGDEPFLEVSHLAAIKELFEDRETEIGTLVRRFGPQEDIGDPNSPKVVLSTGGFALYFSRAPIPYIRDREVRPAGEETYYKHIGLYAYRSEVLEKITGLPPGRLEQAESLEQLRWLENGYRIKVAQVAGETLAVDTPEDLEKVNQIYRKGC